MDNSYLSSLFATLIISSVFTTNAQISTPCTSSMISTFTPCLNYVTGSSGTGSSPTEDCCDAFKSIMSGGMGCACLIATGNVPFSVPFLSNYLAISLPRMCHTSMPIECKASGEQLPAPGPALFGPSAAPPASLAPNSFSPKGYTAVVAPSTDDEIPDSSPPSPPPNPFGQIGNPGIRPVVQQNTASTLSLLSISSLLVVLTGMSISDLF